MSVTLLYNFLSPFPVHCIWQFCAQTRQSESGDFSTLPGENITPMLYTPTRTLKPRHPRSIFKNKFHEGNTCRLSKRSTQGVGVLFRYCHFCTLLESRRSAPRNHPRVGRVFRSTLLAALSSIRLSLKPVWYIISGAHTTGAGISRRLASGKFALQVRYAPPPSALKPVG